MMLCDALALWQAELAAANLSPRTVQAYAYAMRHVCEALPRKAAMADLSRPVVTTLIASLFARGWKPTSVHAIYRPLRTFSRWCVRRGYMVTDPCVDITLKVPVPELAIPTAADVSRVIAACAPRSRHGFRGRRDAAILRVMATTGLRLAEVAGMTLGDLQLEGQPSIRVLGKGRQYRVVPLDVDTVAVLVTYLTRERPRSPYAGSEAVWLASKGPMTPSGIAQMVSDRGASAGVRLHPHLLRHFALSRMLNAGIAEGSVMALSGHSTRSMLDRYTRHDAAERAAAAFLSAAMVQL